MTQLGGLFKNEVVPFNPEPVGEQVLVDGPQIAN